MGNKLICTINRLYLFLYVRQFACSIQFEMTNGADKYTFSRCKKQFVALRTAIPRQALNLVWLLSQFFDTHTSAHLASVGVVLVTEETCLLKCLQPQMLAIFSHIIIVLQEIPVIQFKCFYLLDICPRSSKLKHIKHRQHQLFFLRIIKQQYLELCYPEQPR